MGCTRVTGFVGSPCGLGVSLHPKGPPVSGLVSTAASTCASVVGGALAPGRERPRQTEAGVVESLQAFQPLPGAIRIHGGLQRPAQRREFLVEPGEAAEPIQGFEQAIAQRQQVAHVVERIFDLFIRQRSLGPVRTRVRLGEFHFEQTAGEFAVADLRRQAGECRGDLGVEDAADRADGGQQHFQILACSVQHLDAARRAERCGQGRDALECDRIHADRAARPPDLHQAEFCAICPLAHELRIESECGLLGECGAEVCQCGGLCDETSGRLHV